MDFTTGATSKSLTVAVFDDAGLPVNDLDAASFPVVFWKRAGIGNSSAIVLVDLPFPSTPWTEGGLHFISDGRYRLDSPDAIFSVKGKVTIWAEGTNQHMMEVVVEVGDETDIASAVAAALAAGEVDVTIVAAYSEGKMTIYKGASYTVANGRSVSFPATSLPSLTGGAARFRCKPPDREDIIDYALTISDAGGPSQAIIWALPASETVKLTPPFMHTGFIVYRTSADTDYTPAYEFPVETRSM